MLDKLNAEQGTPEWFEQRKGLLTGSNAGAALGVSPFVTRKQLIRAMVRELHGAEREFKGNIATEYGSAWESTARRVYEMETGNTVQSTGFIKHSGVYWLGASPDGIIRFPEGNGVLEIKCPFNIRGDRVPTFKSIPAHYYAQVQIEMACAGLKWAHFFQWSPYGFQLDEIGVDWQWWDINYPKLERFYEDFTMQKDNEEHLEDFRIVIEDEQAISLAKKAKDIAEQIKALEEERKGIIGRLSAEIGRNAQIGDMNLTRVEKKGSIDYAKVAEKYAPKDVDLDSFRKKSSEYWRLS
jgi:putative phage-type endonuclease